MSCRETLEAVHAALPEAGPGEGSKPHEIAKALGGLYSSAVVIHALRDLIAERRAEFDGPDCGRVYRKARQGRSS